MSIPLVFFSKMTSIPYLSLAKLPVQFFLHETHIVRYLWKHDKNIWCHILSLCRTQRLSEVHHGIRYTNFFGHGDILVNGKIRRNMIKKEVRRHRSVLRDCTLGRLEGSNPKPLSLACELSPLPYLWYYSLLNLYAYIGYIQHKVHHGLRYLDFLVHRRYLIAWYYCTVLDIYVVSHMYQGHQ